MKDLVLDKTELIKWLQENENNVVGYGATETSCPISQYFRDKNKISEQVEIQVCLDIVNEAWAYSVYVDGEYRGTLDKAIGEFITVIDATFPFMRDDDDNIYQQDITGRQALMVLRQSKSLMENFRA